MLTLTTSITRADDINDPVDPVQTNPAANDDINRNIVLPTSPGDHKLKFRTHIDGKLVEMSYLLHLPPDYNDARKKPPMLVFFHGIGECGTDLAGVYALGPMTLLREDGGNRAFAASCPFVVLCPQCPPRGQTWDTDYIYKAVPQLVDQTIKKSRTDPDRVYATGLSMGGLGSWCVAEQAPDLFAGIAPLSAMGWHPENALASLRYVSVWCIVGVDDQPRFFDGTRAMDDALAKGPLKQRFTYLMGNGHDAWFPAYENPQFYEWLLSRRRLSPADRKKLDAQKGPATTQPMPAMPGHYLLSFDTKLGAQPITLDYVLYLPKGYKPGGTPPPTMLFLHEQNTIGPDFHDICMHGPDLALERKSGLAGNFPFAIISPRLPVKCDWQTPGMTQLLLGLIDHVSKSVNIDTDRISVTGINAGAGGAFKLAAEAPDRFSAIVPVLVDDDLFLDDARAVVLKQLPGRAYFKSNQAAPIQHMNTLLANIKQDWRLSKLANTSAPLGDLPIYSDKVLLTWLAAQKRVKS